MKIHKDQKCTVTLTFFPAAQFLHLKHSHGMILNTTSGKFTTFTLVIKGIIDGLDYNMPIIG